MTWSLAGAQEARNPILHADVPDPSIIRVGDTYYMSSTTMHMSPGLPIMKSTDLVNWEMLNYAYDTLGDIDPLTLTNGEDSYGRGSWASSLRYHDGKFYVSTFSSTTGKTYIFSTSDIEKEPWEEISFAPSLHDSSLFFDDDGKVYMLWGAGDLRLTELKKDLTGIESDGFNEVVIANASAPAGENINLPAEGSQLFKVNGKYYLFNIAWPRGGMRTVIVHRADKITGPYEGRLALQDQGVAQGGLIDTPEGKWYAYLFQDSGAVGRIPYLVPVEWKEGWPVLGVNGKVRMELDLPANRSLIPGIVDSDEFDRNPGAPALPLVWQWNHNPDNEHWSLTQRPGHLRITTGRVDSELISARNTLTQRTIGPTCTGTTLLETSGLKDGDVAGLCLLQQHYGLVGVRVDGDAKQIVMIKGLPPQRPSRRERPDPSNNSTQRYSIVEAVPLDQDAVYLRAACDFSNKADKARFEYSLDGETWKSIGDELAMRYTLPHFMGYRFGLFNYATKQAGGHADFVYFHISDTLDTPDVSEPPVRASESEATPGSNPIIRDVFTADPAPLVVGDTLYLYVGRDNAGEGEMFTMPEWLCYSTKDMKQWTSHGAVLKPTDFAWGEANSAWASQVVEKDGRFYYFVTARGKDEPYKGNNVGVAVADSPTGPFRDAIGKPLVSNSTTPNGTRPWEDIDPTVWIEEDGTPWMSWGNGDCYLVKLKPNLLELDGDIKKLDLPHYVEGPWLYKRGKLYYLIYAAMKRPVGSEQIAYATAKTIEGPWEFRGFVTGPAKNSFTIHPGVAEFKGRNYFFYHFADHTIGDQSGALGRRAVCVEHLHYKDDGTIRPVQQTVEGVSVSVAE
ncbi:family 43 glycosylhydrolase [Aeoliella sp. SH292]|uniref:family 43 glycosylhydrolase n=1 Tax=Aeoliella sp. SH292 TaxID=3454464 RepID=UPI003F984DA9